jgi:hypothetical protein
VKKGAIFTQKHRENLRKARIGKKHSAETKQKIGLANKGKIPIQLWLSTIGRKVSQETRDKISKIHKEAFASGKRESWNKGSKGLQKATSGSFRPGKLNPSWNGGGRLRYAEGFTTKLRNTIRQRDNFTCQICFKKEVNVVHHKDKNKTNHAMKNLITLCSSCHRKLHTNQHLPYGR